MDFSQFTTSIGCLNGQVNSKDTSRKLIAWLPGLVLLMSGFAGRIDGALGLLIGFGVLSYLVRSIKKALNARPEIAAYRDQPSQLSAGVVVAIVFLCTLPIFGLLAAIAIPNFIVAKETAQANACIANLKQIEAAKQIWADDNNIQENVTVKWENLVPKYLKQKPVCYTGGSYTIGDLRTPATCSIGNNNTERTRDDHILKKNE